MPPKETFSQVMHELQSGNGGAEKVYERFVTRLIGLAKTRLQNRFRGHVDPEDVVQSVFRSFFLRHAKGQYAFDGWNSVWALLANITVNKCAGTAVRLEAAKRDVRREVHGAAMDAELPLKIKYFNREPTSEEAAILHETLTQLMSRWNTRQQSIISLKLQQYTNEEVAERVGCTERTVYRLMKKVRQQLLEDPDSSWVQVG